MRKTKTGYAQKKRCQSRNRVVSPGGLWWRVYGGKEICRVYVEPLSPQDEVDKHFKLTRSVVQSLCDG